MLGNTERFGLWLIQGFLPLPVDTANQPPCPRPLGSISLSETSWLLRAVPPLRAAFLLQLWQGFCLSRSVRIGAEGSHVPLNRRVTASCHLNAGGRRVRNRLRLCSSQDNDSVLVWTSFLRFRHVISGSLAFISRVTHLTRSLPGLFLLCSRRWLLTNAAEGDLRPAPVGRSRGAFAFPHQLCSYAQNKLICLSCARGARSSA